MTKKMPTASQRQPSVGGLPGGVPYEAIVTAMGTMTEQSPSPPTAGGGGGGGGLSATGEVSIIQGRVNDDPETGFFAFLSVDTLNVPLVSTSRTSRVAPGVYRVRVPAQGKEFLLTLDPRTEPPIVEGMETVLQWFTTFESNEVPLGMVAEMDGEPVALGGVRGVIQRAGEGGAALITWAGQGLNAKVKERTEAALAAQTDKPAKNVKLGGRVTATTLTGARKVVGLGAGVCSVVIDKISTAAGNAVANSSVVAGARHAPEGSTRRQTHDILVTGAVAAARVWEAADGQGKLLLESTGDGVGRVAGAKYGSEAEHAARSTGQIALDGWRIFRFPTKLGVTTLAKGAMKGVTGAGERSASSSSSTSVAAAAVPGKVA